jgi:HNH endonuclease
MEPVETPAPSPYGLCECGCGGVTEIAKQSRTDRGWVRGQPKRWIAGHQNRQAWGPHLYTVEDRGHATPCWIWKGKPKSDGYVDVKRFGKSTKAHRFAWLEAGNVIPEGRELDHLCRVRNCVNPAHLEAVTPTTNVRRSARPKLTLPIAEEIRARATGRRGERPDLAREYGVTYRTIRLILLREIWA